MKSHDLTSFSAMAALAAMAASCSQEPLLPVDSTKEEYTKNFITEFGIPAEGHDFAMAVSAGLRVKTAKGGHVTVTAEVDGKEYLFADLNVPAGTHELPITVPRSVSTVKVKTGFKTFEAGVNDLVDLDADAPGSRGTWVFDSLNATLIGDSNDGIEGPLLAFRPSDFLEEYFEKHPVGAKNTTDYYYQGCDVGEGYALPYSQPNQHLFFGETALGPYAPGYMIFPIWWRKNDHGSKKYSLYLHDINNFDNSMIASFSHPENTDNPFPDLKYYTGDITEFTVGGLKLDENEKYGEQAYDYTNKEWYLQLPYNEDIVSSKLFDGLEKFVTSSGDNAFPMDEATMVISRGMTVKVNNPVSNDCGFAFYLMSDNGIYTSDYSFSVPGWNCEMWGKNAYFNENLNHLFFSYVSTMQYPLYDVFDEYYVDPIHNPGAHSPLDHKFNVWVKRPGAAGNPDRYIGTSGSEYQDGAMLVGFSSAPRLGADPYTNRDYTDFIMLVLPLGNVDLLYQGTVLPDPFIWTMAVEDLGGTDDWDFNDAVFHFTDVVGNLNTVNMNNIFTSMEGPADAVTARVITVWPEATGGTLPIYITFTGTATRVEMPRWGDDKMYSETNAAIYDALNKAQSGTLILGTEVHKWLGNSDYTKFINVGNHRTGKTGQSIQFAIPANTNLSYAEEGVYGSEENKPLYGFSLLVDLGNTLQIDAFESGGGLHLLPDAELGTGTYLIGAPDETGSIAPQMLLIADGDGSWEWPTERTKISDAYQDFNAWISDRNNSTWITSPTEGLVTKK